MTNAIVGLGHVGLYVTDLQRAIAFYRDILGLTVTDYDEERGLCFLSSRPEEEHHEILLSQGRDVDRDGRLLQQVSFRCERFEALLEFYEIFMRQGVEIDRVVTHGNAIGVYFYDPDHNRCEVYWKTGLPARQTFIAAIDITRPKDDVLADVVQLVDRYGATGYVELAPR